MALTKVTTGGITDATIATADIADDAINSEHFTDGSIDTAHIADNQVTAAKATGIGGLVRTGGSSSTTDASTVSSAGLITSNLMFCAPDLKMPLIYKSVYSI